MKFLILLLFAPGLTYGWRIFHRGRHVGGNLGLPGRKENEIELGSPEVPEEWFTQKLDHFNPTDGRTWQQVSNNNHFLTYK